MKIAVANFKANLSWSEAEIWLSRFSKLVGNQALENREIILSPPLVYLELFRWSCRTKKLPVSLAAQVVSEFGCGSYTGEVTAEMLKPYVQYVIIGHSEERKIRNLNTKNIQEKITQANNQQLKVILCAEAPESYAGEVFALAYEPSGSIGTGMAANPQDSVARLQELKAAQKTKYGLYGGSVSGTNVSSYIEVGFDGVLVGKHSLDPEAFWLIVMAL